MESLKGYRLIDTIGKGGMATVYKGIQISLNRPVAVKILSKKMAQRTEIYERFMRESLIIARLSNPHIIHVIDRGVTKKGMPYFIMEYVNGTDLSASIRDKTLDLNRKLELSVQICKALSYAHKNGVIHRDIKPANVIIDEEGNARVLDFGIAQFYDDDQGNNDSSMKTNPGIVMGTLPYISPEQLESASQVTALSDIYSFGALSYELFTGRKPAGRFVLPSEAVIGFPVELEALIMSCLEQDPAKRPSSADIIKESLLKLLHGAHLGAGQRKRASKGITKVTDKFALLDVIRESEFGAVYLYENRQSRELMVIKKRPRSGDGFVESKLLSSLKHDNIVDILGVSKNRQLFIIVMEYVSGGSLQDRLIKPFSLKGFLPVARQICDGLAFAHRNRIIHGNIRPTNILFDDRGRVKLSDFGLDEHYAGQSGSDNWYNIYKEGKSLKTDIFAAGVVFYQMVTGTLPDYTRAHVSTCRVFAELPAELRELISSMLARSHEKRPRSFEHIGHVFDALAEHVSGHQEGTDALHTAATEYLGSDTLQAPNQQTARIAGRHYSRALFLLILLYAVGITYLSYTGKIETYKTLMSELIDSASSSAAGFYDDTLLPFLKLLQKTAQSVYSDIILPAVDKARERARELFN